MPPFQSRSTGASRTDFISSAGVSRLTPSSMPRAARIGAVIGIDLALRGKTPPPAEISDLS